MTRNHDHFPAGTESRARTIASVAAGGVAFAGVVFAHFWLWPIMACGFAGICS